MLNTLLRQSFLDEHLVPELEQGTVQYFDHIRRYLLAQQYAAGKVILDIACGTGYGSAILQQSGAKQVISADISPAVLTYAARQWSTGCFVQANAQQLALAPQSIDLIVSFETLEHLPEPRLFLAEAKRILKRSGTLILSTPNRAIASPGSATPFSPFHAFEPTLPELRSLLTDAGWTITALHGITHSARAERLIHPAQAPYPRRDNRIAWAAYLRLWFTSLMPPLLFNWLSRQRHIPTLTIADSVLVEHATESSAYFVAVCELA